MSTPSNCPTKAPIAIKAPIPQLPLLLLQSSDVGAGQLNIFDDGPTAMSVGLFLCPIDSLVPGGPFGSQSDKFTYDSYNRLAAAQVAGTSYVYDMDAADNRKGILTNGVRTDYTIEGHNLLTKVDGDDYAYDGRGNLIQAGTMQYEYDDENRLTTARANGQAVAAYWYDGNGNRVRSIEGTKTIDYVYDGLNVIQ